MEDKRMKEILRKKEEIEGKIKAINLKINSLKNTKKDYEKKERKLNKEEKLSDSYKNKIEKINEDINQNEQQKKKMEDAKKELSTRIRTIRCSETKIANKTKVIEELNFDIKNINDEINASESEKIKKLLELERKNISRLNNLKKKDKSLENLKKLYENDDKKIELIDLQIKEAKEELNNLEERIAHQFEEICKKYDLIKKEKKDIIKKKAIELKKVNKSIESFKCTIERSFLKIEDVLEKYSNYNIIIVKNTSTLNENKTTVKNEMERFAQTIKQINKTEKVEVEANYGNLKQEKQANYENLEQEKGNIEAVQEKLEQEEDILGNQIYMDEIKKIKENEKEGKIEEIEIVENETDKFEETNDFFVPIDIQLGGPMYKQAYANMVRRNGSTNIFEFDDEIVSDIDDAKSKCANTLVYDWEEEKTIKKMIVKEANENEDSEKKYIEIDGKKYKHNRNLDDETKGDLDYLCKEYLNISKKMTLTERIKLKMLKSKIDPAVVNAIKYRIKSRFREVKNEIIKNCKCIKTDSEIKYMIENVKRSCKYEYTELITQYIKFLEEKDSKKLSFYLYYDCSENLNSSKYMEIYPYIYNAGKSGAIIIDNKTPKEIIQGLFKKSEEPHNMITKIHIEGDKSFIPKVNIPSPVPVKVYSENKGRTRVNGSHSLNKFNGYR